jgi:hypothetical protein
LRGELIHLRCRKRGPFFADRAVSGRC